MAIPKSPEAVRSPRAAPFAPAHRDADGYFHYIGRADDVFKSSDYRLSPFELESALIEHPCIAEAAVVPSPDPIRWHVPKAFITLKPGLEATRDMAEVILRFVRGRLAPYKRIRHIEFYELPKTMPGKIRRVQLRGLESQPNRTAVPVSTGKMTFQIYEGDKRKVLHQGWQIRLLPLPAVNAHARSDAEMRDADILLNVQHAQPEYAPTLRIQC